jgi:hypothetical protein
MAISKFSTIRALIWSLALCLFVQRLGFSTSKTPDGCDIESTILKSFVNTIDSKNIANQYIKEYWCFIKQLIWKNDRLLPLIEFLSLSLENLKVEVIC